SSMPTCTCYCAWLLSFYSDGGHRVLHSFPTRRSSDLRSAASPGKSCRGAVDVLQPGEASGGLPTVLGWGWDVDADRAFRRLLVVDRKSTRLNSSHVKISYAVFCLKKKTRIKI